MNLTHSFFSVCGPFPGLPYTPDVLEPLLHACYERGVRAWPEVHLAGEEFAAYLGARARKAWQSQPVEQLLNQLHVSDLYLCAACLRGDAAALRLFERVYLSRIAGWLEAARLHGVADEVEQTLRIRFLIGDEGKEPKLADYVGRGPLGGWIRTAACRLALDQESVRERIMPVGESVGMARLDPELACIKARYGDEFRAALQEAVSSLSVEARNLLRMYGSGQVTTREIAALSKLSQPTVVRRLESARDGVRVAMRRILRERLRISDSEIVSLIEVLLSQLELNLE